MSSQPFSVVPDKGRDSTLKGAERNPRFTRAESSTAPNLQLELDRQAAVPARSGARPLGNTGTLRMEARERFRLAVTLIVTLGYFVLLAVMIYVSTLPPMIDVGASRDASGRWIITSVMPSGLGYDRGVRVGDVVVSVDGRPTMGAASLNLAAAQRVQVTPGHQGAGRGNIVVDTASVVVNNPLQRWAFILLGLLFIGIGGPVFIKAQQRAAATAFYVFGISTAVTLAIASVPGIYQGWALVLSFVSLIVFAASFGLFFLEFPVRVGRTPREHFLLSALVIGIGFAVLLGYVWVLLGHSGTYEWISLLLDFYIAGSVTLGLITLGLSLRRQRSPDVRQQLVLLLGGTALAVGPGLLLSILPEMLFGQPLLRPSVSALTLGLMPLAFAYAISQHQLLGVRNLLRRGVVYLIMGATVLLAFSLAATMLSAVVPEGWERSEWGLIGFSFFVFLIAFSFGHLQRRVEKLVDRYIYHDAYDYKEALLQFSSQLASEQKLSVLAEQLVERTCRLMNLSCGVLLLAAHDNDDNSFMPGSLYRPAGLPTVMLNDLDVPQARHANGLGIPDSAWGRQANGRRATREDDGFVHLEVYARYGSAADYMVARLHRELSHFGVRLRDIEALMSPDTGALTTRLRESVEQPPDGTPRLCEGSKVRRVVSLADALAGTAVSEVVSTPEDPNEPTDAELQGIRSFLGVPLWTRSRFVGVLCLAGKRTGERFTRDDLSLLTTLGSQAALAIYNAQLYEVREQALLDTIAALAHAIEAKDGYTIEHCEKMMGRAVAVARAMRLPRQEVENVRLGAILHDVGKIGIPDAVLNKPGKLTPEEYEVIKQHATIGARIVQSVGALQGVVPIVRHHQERYDGSGYPDGISGEAIPLGARIIGVVDTYGAMTEDRVYRRAPGHDRALAELQRLAGMQFDPNVVEVFIRVLAERPDLAERQTAGVS